MNGDEKRVPIFDTIIVVVALLCNICELICFVVIFYTMFKHARRHAALCLANKPRVVRKKKKRNVITAAGHFTSWCAEMALFCVLGVILTAGLDKLGAAGWMLYAFMTLVPSINYVVFPCVQVVSSQELREHVFSLGWPTLEFRWPRWTSKVADAVAEIEMGQLSNGHIINIINNNGHVVHHM